ncbi:hypothetical protein Tco_0210663 [Tanacetum coccineum]
MDDIIREKNAQFADFEKEIINLKQTLYEQSKEKELLTKTFNVFKNESKEKEAKNTDTEIALEKKVKELDNILKQALGFQNPFYLKKAQQIRPMLYDGSVIAKETNVISIADSEETLMLEEENFGIRFILQQELSDEQAFRLQTSHPNTDQFASSLVNMRLLGNFLSVKKDIDEIDIINIELEQRVAKLIAENEHLKQTYKQLYDSIKPLRVRAKEHAKSFVNQLNQKSVEITNLNAQLQEKVFVTTALKNDLRKFKGKDIVDNAAQVSNTTTIAPVMYKLDPVTLAPKDKNNRETHIYYLKHTKEQAVILMKIVEQAKLLNPLDSASYSARVSQSTKFSRSTSIDNTKNDRILQISSSTYKKNKVEDHSRIVNSMFDARHELCFLEFVSNMNASSKSMFVKKAKKKEEWKPTGKVFTKIGYNWRPTGRTFTLVGNACPLPRITATNKVSLREPIPIEVVARKSVVTKVYTRRPKVPKTNGSNTKPKIAKSMFSNKMKPGTSRGSNTLVAPSFSSVDLRLSKLFCGIWTPDAPST